MSLSEKIVELEDSVNIYSNNMEVTLFLEALLGRYLVYRPSGYLPISSIYLRQAMQITSPPLPNDNIKGEDTALIPMRNTIRKEDTALIPMRNTIRKEDTALIPMRNTIRKEDTALIPLQSNKTTKKGKKFARIALNF